jgi:hypothetical protein
LSLIKEADLIHLHTLAHRDKQSEFAPPKNGSPKQVVILRR